MIRVDKHVEQTVADEVYHIVPSLNFSTASLRSNLIDSSYCRHDRYDGAIGAIQSELSKPLHLSATASAPRWSPQWAWVFQRSAVVPWAREASDTAGRDSRETTESTRHIP